MQSLPELLSRVDQTAIEALRSRVYEYTFEHPNEIDITDVRTRIPETLAESQARGSAIPDLTLRRCLLFSKPKNDIDAALQKFISFFTFRQKYGMTRMKFENVLPAEYYKAMVIIDTGATDRIGNKLIVLRAKGYRKFPQTEDLLKRTLLFLVEQYDLKFERGEFSAVTLLCDLRGFNYWRDLQLEYIPFGLQMLSFYRGICTKALGYELHWAFSFLYNIFHTIVGKVLGTDNLPVYLINEKSIEEHVERSQIPEFLGGTWRLSPSVPETAPSFLEHLKVIKEEENIEMDEDVARRIDEHFKQMSDVN